MKHIASVITDLEKKIQRLTKRTVSLAETISETRAAIDELKKLG